MMFYLWYTPQDFVPTVVVTWCHASRTPVNHPARHMQLTIIPKSVTGYTRHIIVLKSVTGHTRWYCDLSHTSSRKRGRRCATIYFALGILYAGPQALRE